MQTDDDAVMDHVLRVDFFESLQHLGIVGNGDEILSSELRKPVS